MDKYVTEEEKREFQEAMKKMKKSIPQPSHEEEYEKDVYLPHFPLDGIIPDLAPEDPILHRASGAQEKMIKKLKTQSIDAELDLHGYTLKEACEQVQTFLRHAYRSNYHVLRIIHGKGKHSEKAVLKSRVVYWLKMVPWVLLLKSAPSQDGGTGALYVVLKQHK